MKTEKKRKFSLLFIPHDIIKIILGIPGLIWHRPKLYYENKKSREHIKGGAIIISNHLGFYDPIYIQYAVWYRRHHFICLQKFFNSKLSWLFKCFLCIPIDKENFSMNSFHNIVDHLENDELVSMFPEGKVNDGSGEMATFKSGVILMALKSKKPIIPLYINEKKHWYERIRMIIGEPIILDNSISSFSSVNSAINIVKEKEDKLKTILEDYICKPKVEK